jgi:heme/copper-type cytochrome/quinol oxidase subunit 3
MNNTLAGHNLRKSTHHLAMMVALVSWAMLFATLFLGYTIFRFSNKVWPPMGMEKISLFIPSMSLIIIAVSSWSMELTKKYYQAKNFASAKRNWLTTIILGLAFLLSQYFLWQKLHQVGLFAHMGIFPSILHGFTWIHFAHVVLGILGLLYLRPIFKASSNTEEFFFRLENVLKFWHFLGIIWLIMYLVLFVF